MFIAVLLTSGRNLSPSNEPMLRSEGVALVSCGDAISSWEAAGKQWRSWSGKIGEKQHDFLNAMHLHGTQVGL